MCRLRLVANFSKKGILFRSMQSMRIAMMWDSLVIAGRQESFYSHSSGWLSAETREVDMILYSIQMKVM